MLVVDRALPAPEAREAATAAEGFEARDAHGELKPASVRPSGAQAATDGATERRKIAY